MVKNFVDFSDAYKKIAKTKKSAESVAVKGINIASEYARKELEKNAPQGRRKKYKNVAKYNNTNYRDYDLKHIKDHTAIKKATKNNLNAEVGFDEDVAWRVHFLEFGTIKMRPQPFVQKTIKEVEDEVADIIQKYLKEALGQ